MDFATRAALAQGLGAIHFESAARIRGSKEFGMTDIRVRINGMERGLNEADAQWVHQSMATTPRHTEGHCVEVSVHGDDVNLRLATCACSGGGGFRTPNDHENDICHLWRRFHLGERAPQPRAVCDFLNALRRHFGLRAA
jgi:hypothetical protein